MKTSLLNVIDQIWTDVETGEVIWKGKKILSSDKMIEEMAKRWIEMRGDAEGFLYSWKQIHEKLKEIEEKDV
jgi:hypothetical protein